MLVSFIPELMNEVASSFTSYSSDGQIANEELVLNPSSLKKKKQNRGKCSLPIKHNIAYKYFNTV